MDEARRFDAGAPLFWALLALLAWAPIPLGSNRAWAWTLLELGVDALFALWLAAWALGLVAASVPMRRAWPAWILLGAWLLLQALHVVPMPLSWVAALSPEAARMHALPRDLGIEAATATLSIDPQASRVALMKSLAYAGTFFLVLALAARRSRVLLLARILVYEAVALSVYAVSLHLSNTSQEYFGTLLVHGDAASGTYANRNHFAGYLEMSLALGIGLLVADLSDRKADSWRRLLRFTLEWILSPKMVLRLALCVLVIALTTTHSRMGNSAFFASLVVAGAGGIAFSRHAPRKTVLLLASLIAIDLFIVGSWFGVEKLAERLGETTVADVQNREAPAAHALPLLRDYAVFGSGPGTFYIAFPRYRPPTVGNFYSQTHNDYVQFAAESGLAGAAVIGAFVLSALGAALAAQWRRRDPLMRGISFACLMGTTSILIHSWVDFNLQIPANVMLFMTLLALGWVALYLDRDDADRVDRVRINPG
jgi:O-antigen ligase